MISPLQGGSKRRIGWDGPSLAGPRGTRHRLRRWLAGVVAGLATVAALLTVGAADLGSPSPLRVIGTVTPDRGADRPERAERREHRLRERREEVAVSYDGGKLLPVRFEEPPAAGVAFDLRTGDILWRRESEAVHPIASLTKIMTALLVTEEIENFSRRIRIDRHAAGAAGSGTVLGSAVGLEEGMRVKAGALFHAMLVSSANDAASALAIEAAGSSRRFVKRMNRRAQRLGLDCTRFASPHGLEPGNRSCAADVASLVRAAMEAGRIRRVAGKARAVVDFPIKGGERHLASTNPLLQEGYRGTVGLKTGFTYEAGQSLAAVVRRGGRTVGVVLLDSPASGKQAKRLFEAAFDGGKAGRGQGPDRGWRSRGRDAREASHSDRGR